MEPPSHTCTSTHLEEEGSTPDVYLLFLVIFMKMKKLVCETHHDVSETLHL